MSIVRKEQQQPRNEGAIKAGNGEFIFKLPELARIDAGRGYSTAEGPVVEGERMQIGLIKKQKGTGARAHTHPNEQWTYILKGTLRVKIGEAPEQLCGPGTLLYLPANIVHYTIATADADVEFFTVKDLTYGIHGKPVDGKMTGGHYDPGSQKQ